MILKPTLIASRHDSHRPIALKRFPRQVVVNFGNKTLSDTYKGLVINTPEACRLAVDKFKMKALFEANDIPSFEWGGTFHNPPMPIVIKSITHRKTRPHLCLVRSKRDIALLFDGAYSPRWERFYWEKFTSYDREFRIHASRYKFSEVFATEKVSRFESSDVWIKNNSSCKFVKKFDKPSVWGRIIRACRKALKITGLDIAGFDVAYDSKSEVFYIIEVNTACGMKKNTRTAYTKELNKIALLKQIGL